MKAHWSLVFLFIKNCKSRQGLVEHQKVVVFCDCGSRAGCWNAPAPRDSLLLLWWLPTDRPAPRHLKHHSEGRNLQSVPSWKRLSCDGATLLCDSVTNSPSSGNFPNSWDTIKWPNDFRSESGEGCIWNLVWEHAKNSSPKFLYDFPYSFKAALLREGIYNPQSGKKLSLG